MYTNETDSGIRMTSIEIIELLKHEQRQNYLLQAENERLRSWFDKATKVANEIEGNEHESIFDALLLIGNENAAQRDEIERLRDALEKISKVEASSDKVICIANIAWVRRIAQEAMKTGGE